MASLNEGQRQALWKLNKAQPQGDRGKSRETGQSNKCGAGFASPAGVSQGHSGRGEPRAGGAERSRASGAGPPRGSSGRSGGVRSRPPRAGTGLSPSGSAWPGLGRFPPGASSTLAPRSCGRFHSAVPHRSTRSCAGRSPGELGTIAPCLPSLSPRGAGWKNAPPSTCATPPQHILFTRNQLGAWYIIYRYFPPPTRQILCKIGSILWSVSDSPREMSPPLKSISCQSPSHFSRPLVSSPVTF